MVTWNNILVDHQHNPWSSLRSTRWLPVGSMYLGSRLNISLSDPQTVHSKKFLIRTFYSPLFLPKHCVKIWRSPPRSFFSIFFILSPPPPKVQNHRPQGCLWLLWFIWKVVHWSYYGENLCIQWGLQPTILTSLPRQVLQLQCCCSDRAHFFIFGKWSRQERGFLPLFLSALSVRTNHKKCPRTGSY
jgi:hypothetical protein